MTQSAKYLVLQSGGIKGICILGALQYLEEKNMLSSIEAFAGSSVGSLLCLLVVVGYSVQELLTIATETNFESLLTDYWFRVPLNLLRHNGLNSGVRFMDYIGSLLDQKGIHKDITFQELYEKTKRTLVITGTSLSSRETFYFQKDSFPDMKVLEALRISISIPLFFTSVRYQIDDKEHTFVDGAVLNNFPLYYFDMAKQFGRLFRSSSEFYTDGILKGVKAMKERGVVLSNEMQETLGVMVLEKNYKPCTRVYYTGFDKVNNIKEFIASVLNTMTTQLEKESLENPLTNSADDVWSRTVCVLLPFEVGIANFNSDKEAKTKMIECGYNACLEFVEKNQID
jgi:NTE family protein